MNSTTAPRAPLIVNLGMGVDSVAMLVGLHAHGERPDLVIFADVGAEKPETYAYLPTINAWLASVGFPLVTVVKRVVGPAGYRTLEENVLQNETLPSLAFNMKGCSAKWKAEAMDHWLLGCKRGVNAHAGFAPVVEAVAVGVKPVKCIGYDAGPKDARRTGKDECETFRYRYPLREWGWTREECMRQIAAAGLPVPVKSACFFCPASKEWELLWLAAKHPEHFMRTLKIEDTARAGKHGLTEVKGLWGRKAPKGALGDGSWRSWAEANGIVDGDKLVGDAAAMMARAMAAKPAGESNSALPCEAPEVVQIGRKARASQQIAMVFA